MPEQESQLVDYHCHLDLYPDYIEQFKACERNRITVLSVTTTPRAWPRNCELAGSSRYIRVGLGLHPQLVGEKHNDEKLFFQYFDSARFIGEVGLDASPQYFKTFDQQVRVFEDILRRCDQSGGKILSVHSVRAVGQVLRSLDKRLSSGRSTAVLHWFGGSRQEVARAVGLGCYFSINHEMLLKESRRTIIASMPVDRLLTETDGPFTQVQCGQVASAIASLATLFSLNDQAMKTQILNNVAALEQR